MTTETLTTTAAATTTESAGADSTQATETTATGAGEGGQQQTAQSTEATAANGEKASEAQKAEGAPESYNFTAPEGKEFDDRVLTEFSAVAKDLNLTQEAAQQMLDRIGPALEARNAARISEAAAEWAENSMADKEFGGAAVEQNLAMAKKALDTFGTPELRDLLNETGLGNHPEIIRVLYRAGKAISEDTFVAGGGGMPNSRDARNLYAKSNMNP